MQGCFAGGFRIDGRWLSPLAAFAAFAAFALAFVGLAAFH